MVSRILVPIDFSSFSEPAIRKGSEYAKLFGAELILCHAIAPSLYPEGMGYGSPTEDDIRHDLEARLSEMAKEMVDAEVTVQAHVWTGTPYRAVTDNARELGVDLIILPTQGRTGLSHLFMGSTAERVVRTAPCDVLVIACKGLKKAGG